MTRRRRIDPFPLDLLYDEPGFLILPAVARGMALNLMWHYWLTDGAPLPVLDSQRFSLAQGNSGPWAAYRIAIRACLDSLIPKIERSRSIRQEKLDRLKRLSHAGNSIRRLRALNNVHKSDAAAPVSPRAAPRRRQELQMPDQAADESGFVDKLSR